MRVGKRGKSGKREFAGGKMNFSDMEREGGRMRMLHVGKGNSAGRKKKMHADGK